MSIVLNLNDKKLIVPEKDDPCQLWVSYFSALQKEVGTTSARELWLVTWQKNGSVYCTTNQGFNTWLQKNKIDVSNAYTRNLATTTRIGSNVLELLSTSSGFLKVAVPVTAGIILLLLLRVLYNTSKQATINDVTPIIPTTKALKLL